MRSLPLSITDAADALRAGTVTSVELTQIAIERADALGPQLGTYLCRGDDAALSAASAADADLAAGRDRGPMLGIPVVVKDILATEDLPTTAQSLVLDAAWGKQGDAPAVARLRAAGAVITGKSSTMEFAIGLPDPDKPFPIPRNPWSLTAWSGGSSSGTANGVAAGIFLGGIGTDTGGSIRMPSALCGITGLKPTFGRVPKAGVVPLASSLDHVGPMARSARDCALLLQVLAGHDATDPCSLDVAVPDYAGALTGSLDGVRIGVERAHYAASPFVDPVTIERFEAAVDELARAGAELMDVELPLYDALEQAALITTFSEAFTYHRKDLQERWSHYGAFTRLMVSTGAFFTAADYVQAQRVRARARQETADLLRSVDVIAGLTAGAGAPPVEGLDFAVALTLPVFTPVYNGLGFPALSVPIGLTDAGLPVGMQLAGPPFDESLVLRVGDAYQRRTNWHLRPPPLS